MISPGIEISLEALAARARRGLPRVDIEEPRHAIGKGTKKEAIQAGVVYGYAGHCGRRNRRAAPRGAGRRGTTIATGGYAAAIAPYVSKSTKSTTS